MTIRTVIAVVLTFLILYLVLVAAASALSFAPP